MLCLAVPSDENWARMALADLDSVLLDHAHCEMKAASNALSLATRHPGNLRLVRALTDLAREEIDHFQRVLFFLDKRGLTLGPPPVDDYAANLRKAAAASRDPHSISPLVDRLLVGALIEARSCERFKLLLSVMSPQEHAELYAFYTELFAAEARHFRTFVDLAELASDAPRSVIEARLETLSAHEASIVRELARAPESLGEKRGSERNRATIHG